VTIEVKLGGFLRKKVAGHKDGLIRIELPEGAAVKDAVEALGLEPEDVKIIFLNHQGISDNRVLSDGDRLGLFPPQLAYNTFVAIYYARGLKDRGNPT
jgi:molybdopterin converting factor small subunit